MNQTRAERIHQEMMIGSSFDLVAQNRVVKEEDMAKAIGACMYSVIEFTSIQRETEKAILIERIDQQDEGEIAYYFYWIPKSQIFNGSFNQSSYEKQNILIIPNWLFRKAKEINNDVELASLEYNNEYYGDIPQSSEGHSSSDFYNDSLDLDQQSPEFWDSL